jgi:hypothetical protein
MPDRPGRSGANRFGIKNLAEYPLGKETDMTHPADDKYENNEPFSSPCDMPPLEPVGEQPAPPESAETIPAAPSPAANENVAPPVQAAEQMRKDFERHAEDSFRMAAGANAETIDGFYAAATEVYENASEAMRASAETLASGIAQFNMKLLEIGRRNAESNLDYMRSVSGARTMRDLVDAQTAYMRGQYEAMTAQLRELQSLSTELAGKSAAPFQEQMVRATQLPRIC